jgi:hypothetical protein
MPESINNRRNMNIPPFSLPSNPVKKISLREATVSDALDFCDADPGMEEHLTTIFLNRVQAMGSEFYDSKLWTADDRRLGLYWYWLHTTDDAVIKLKYDCGHCGKPHSIPYDMRKLAEGYKAITGKPERELLFGSETVMIRPLTGADMEAIELIRLAILPDTTKKEARKVQSRIRLTALMRSLWFSSTGMDEDRIASNEKRLLSMSMSELKSLADIAAQKMVEMEHGLETVLDKDESKIFLTIRTKCEVNGGMTLLWVPFRSFVNIPMV